MQDCDWTGTAAAVTALALTAGVWLWPSDKTPDASPDAVHRAMVAEDGHGADDMVRWRAEAMRWDHAAGRVQLSAAGASGGTAAVMLR